MERVSDYPRRPRVEHVTRHVRVVLGGIVLAETRTPARVLEMYHPPVYYFSPDDVLLEHLARSSSSSACEWKGIASYFDVSAGGKVARNAAWTYPDPTSAFASIRDWIAFYPAPMDECTVDGEIAKPQPGGFYGGWITRDIVGPFKGESGTTGW